MYNPDELDVTIIQENVNLKKLLDCEKDITQNLQNERFDLYNKLRSKSINPLSTVVRFFFYNISKT